MSIEQPRTATMKHDYYVDGETGKDSNPGTVDKPMKTISGVVEAIEYENQKRLLIIEGGRVGEGG